MTRTHREQVALVLGLVLAVVHHVCGHRDLLLHHVAKRQHRALRVVDEQALHYLHARTHARGRTAQAGRQVGRSAGCMHMHGAPHMQGVW